MYAGIFSHTGAKWGTSQGFQLGQAEAKKLSTALGGDRSALKQLATGFTVCSQQYVVLKADVMSEDGYAPYLLARCIDEGKTEQMVIVIFTVKALLVGVYHPKYSRNKSLGQVAHDLTQLADYIIGVGY